MKNFLSETAELQVTTRNNLCLSGHIASAPVCVYYGAKQEDVILAELFESMADEREGEPNPDDTNWVLNEGRMYSDTATGYGDLFFELDDPDTIYLPGHKSTRSN